MSLLKRGYSLLFFGGLLYAGFLLCLTSPALQRNLLYLHRAKPFWGADLTKPELYGFANGRVRPFHIQTPDDERIFAWHVLPFNLYSAHREELEAPNYDYAKHTELLRNDPEARVVIYMHGTAGTIAATDNRLNTYRTWSLLPGNVHVLTIDYRGFGLSTGEPSEEGLVTDGISAVQWAMENGVAPERIAIVGQSLGSAVSIAVANELASQGTYIRALLPICGFASLTQIVTTYRLVGFIPILSPLRVYPLIQNFIINNFLYEKWDSATRLRSFAEKTRGKDVSITIMHSVYDMDIPYASSRLLFQSAITGSLHAGQDMTCAMDDTDPTVAPDFAKGLVDKRTIGSGGSVYTFKAGEGEKEGRIQYVELDWGGHNRMQKADSVLMALGKALGVL
ncbi:alpha/beta-hydrolase [Saitoella complicata NRRL Y-17804]|nr:alpha/beta-hydrolase [Saitoella complicata NRRL Y-17804]ODQ51173.1 alpha/beta-hydrolase [Saitoella complicata NRRL Y-17804]